MTINIYIFKEKTSDRGWEKRCSASNNNATYILTSAYAHDTYKNYVYKYGRVPSSRWYNRHFNFERI